MTATIKLTVQNKFCNEKRDLNIYHHADRSAYMISHCNTATITMDPADKDDYLHISVVSGPGRLTKPYQIDLPSWCDFSITTIGTATLRNKDNRTVLEFPPGPPDWQLKIMGGEKSTGTPKEDHIVVGE